MIKIQVNVIAFFNIQEKVIMATLESFSTKDMTMS